MPADLLFYAAGIWFAVDKGFEAVDDHGEETPESYEVTDQTSNTSRGRVLALTAQQRAMRARYLAGEVNADALDSHVRSPARTCPMIYYRLSNYNGGKDPTAADPATRWRSSPAGQLNVTSDCMGGAAWCGGFDRYQPTRFAHIYDGWINTDSMIKDALGPAKCFRLLTGPEVGCFVVAASGSGAKKAIGHIGVVTDVPTGFRPLVDPWERVGVVDIAARVGRANLKTTARGWQGRGGYWIVPTMR
jgi:hypothetical protein